MIPEKKNYEVSLPKAKATTANATMNDDGYVQRAWHGINRKWTGGEVIQAACFMQFRR